MTDVKNQFVQEDPKTVEELIEKSRELKAESRRTVEELQHLKQEAEEILDKPVAENKSDEKEEPSPADQ